MALKPKSAPAPETKPRNYASPATSTAKFLDAIQATARPQYFPIYGCEGLFVGVTPLTSKGGGGVKSWRYQDKVEGGKKILLTLGRYGVGHLSMEAAKSDADWARDLCRKGIDPRDHVAPSQVAPADLIPTPNLSGAVTFRVVAEDWFVAWVKARNAETTQANQRWLLDKYVLKEFGDQVAENMTPKPVVRWLNGIAKDHPTTANRLRALISKLSNWAIAERDEIKQNLTTGYVKAVEDSEEEEGIRMYPDEIKRLGKAWAASRDPHKWAIIMPLLTGCRKGAVQNIHRGWTDNEASAIHFPKKAPGLKGCKIVYLPSVMLEHIDQVGLHLTSTITKKSWNTLREAAELDKIPVPAAKHVEGEPTTYAITLHDCRRTFMSMGLDLGHDENTMDALLGHSRGKMKDTYGVRADPTLQALAEEVGSHIWSLLMSDVEETADPKKRRNVKPTGRKPKPKVTEEILAHTVVKPVPVVGASKTDRDRATAKTLAKLGVRKRK
jgi:integrase